MRNPKGAKSPNWKGGVYASDPAGYHKRYQAAMPNSVKSQRKRDRYRIFKAMWVAYKGGKCQDCNGVFPICCFQFHHREPAAKLFEIASGAHKAYDTVKAEVDKCDLLCANCHFIREYADE